MPTDNILLEAEKKKLVAAQRLAAADFTERWVERGYEKGDTHAFWLDLLKNVLSISDAVQKCRFEQRTSGNGFIDVFIPDAKTLVEQKSKGVSLDKPEQRQGILVTPFQQAKRYADTLPNSQRPDFIIVCNFEQFRIHDLNQVDAEHNYTSFTLDELPDQFHLLNFLVDQSFSRGAREEQISIQAGALIGQLYDALLQQYVDPDAADTHHSLNVLCVRLVFCLFAEDAGLFGKDAFLKYLNGVPANRLRTALLELFEVLNTPLADRSPYLHEDLQDFPYVNGGLFKEVTEVPNFTEDIRSLLIDEVSKKTDWSQISPTIFGGVFESTLNPETRRSGGMHYTSPENIHRVIDPLFLWDLQDELQDILEDTGVQPRTRKARLQRFQVKLGSLRFFDSACGSGNFLTETFIHLRRLENQVIAALEGGHMTLDVTTDNWSRIHVTLDQFAGIEINDFAVNVAKTALWIAQLQANIETETILLRPIDNLPLHDDARIVQGNALRLDWEAVLPASECSFVIGNPPFIGYSSMSKSQGEDMALVFENMRGHGQLDYVAAWYRKAVDYMEGTSVRAAFVSTNSICQGQQVTPLWRPLFARGVEIDFAHQSFVWGNEANTQAHVHVVIIGFSFTRAPFKRLFKYQRNTLMEVVEAEFINGYLVDAPPVFIDKRSKPICDVPEMSAGGKPTEGGNLLLWEHEKNDLLLAEPELLRFVRPFSMGEDFIKGKKRFCLWLPEINPVEIVRSPQLKARTEAVREMRLASSKAATRKKADTPWLFDEIRDTGDVYLAVPKVSSERREYVPLGFVDDGMIPGDMLYFIPTGSLFIFGVMMSQFHNAWMRVVAGRLKSDYRYANTIVYNNYIWPTPSDSEKAAVEAAAQAVLAARSQYPGATLAELYDPNNSTYFPALTKAHQRLDAAVEAAYHVNFAGDESKIVAHLFDLYRQAIS